MIIVSQNGNCILNFEAVRQLYIDDRKVCADYGPYDDAYITLGTYADEDRAKLVLRQIVDCYSSYQATEGGAPTLHTYVQPLRFTPPKVFEMPEDCLSIRSMSLNFWLN